MCERMVEGVEGLFPVGGFQLTFPDSNAMPSHVSKPFLLLNVPLPVAVYLPLPEVDICFRHPEEAASLVAVPEAAVDEDVGAIWCILSDFRRSKSAFYRNSDIFLSLYQPFRQCYD